MCIDTCAFGPGWLTCLNPKTGEYWQANEAEEVRKGMLGGGADPEGERRK